MKGARLPCQYGLQKSGAPPGKQTLYIFREEKLHNLYQLPITVHALHQSSYRMYSQLLFDCRCQQSRSLFCGLRCQQKLLHQVAQICLLQNLFQQALLQLRQQHAFHAAQLRCYFIYNNIDVARVMETLRHMARREGLVQDRPIESFWKSFLDTVKLTGRSFEIGVMADYMMRTGRGWGNMDMAPAALLKCKLPFLPSCIQGRDEVARIFKRYAETKKEGRQ